MRARAALLLLSIPVGLVAFARDARANDYYVATNGTQNGTGSMSSPWSLAKAVSTTGATAGDTVFIRGGNYTGAYAVANTGNGAAWITFRAYPGELPILNGNGGGGTAFGSTSAEYVRVVGIAARNYAYTGFGNGWVNDTGTSNGHWEFINCIAEGNGVNGITFYNASGLLIDQSIVAHNGNANPSWSSGVNLFHLSGDATTNIVRRTVSFENIDITTTHTTPAGATDGNGFILDVNSSGALFENNLGFRNGGSCIRINAPGARLINNTCYHDGLNPIDRNPNNPGEIFFSNGLLGAVMINNLAAASGYNGTMTAINQISGTGNLTINANGATPFFVDPANLDFRIVAGSTTVIDKGTTASAPATDIGFDPKCLKQQSGQPVSWWITGIDYDYITSVGGVAGCFHPTARPVGSAPDIGAYELSAGTGGAGGNGGAGGAGGAGGNGGSTGSAGRGGSGGTTGSAGRGGTGGGGGTAGSAGGGGGGTTGSAGRGGTSGTTGSAGRGGTGGTTGSAGRGGTGGSAGRGGRGGTTGSAGRGGTGGTTGSAGRGGTSGAAGSTGGAAGSTGGAAGTGDPSGVAGAGGSAGSAGSAGSSGVAGGGGTGVAGSYGGGGGRGGTTGAAGAGGAAGTTGRGGSGAAGTTGRGGSGAAGTTGRGGSGAAGTTGRGGTTGAAGVTGTAGTTGRGGTTGAAGSGSGTAGTGGKKAPPPIYDTSPGCGCDLGAGSPASSGLAALLGLFGMVVARTRRRR